MHKIDRGQFLWMPYYLNGLTKYKNIIYKQDYLAPLASLSTLSFSFIAAESAEPL